MSDRDELIAKARELSEAVTAGPWRSRTWQQFDPGSDIARDIVGVQSETGHVIAECWSGNADAEAEFIAESRTLLPALADLAESEGRRADQLHRDLVHCREVECGHYIAERDMARDEVKRLDAALVKSAEYIAKVETERDAALAELAALKGQQP